MKKMRLYNKGSFSTLYRAYSNQNIYKNLHAQITICNHGVDAPQDNRIWLWVTILLAVFE